MAELTAKEMREMATSLLRSAIELDGNQVDREGLSQLTTSEIVEARKSGKLNNLLGIENPTTKETK